MLLDIFKEIYELPQDSEFKRLKLEDALIEKFGDLHYDKYKDIIEIKGNSPRYFVSCKNKWGIYELSSDPCGASAEEALILFFIKYGLEPKEGTEEYYIGNFKKEFHEIVKEVYGC